MKPCIPQAFTALALFLCSFLMVHATASAQAAENAGLMLETQFSFPGSSESQFRTLEGGENILIEQFSEEKFRLAVGVGLRMVNVNNWYSRYALIGFSLDSKERTTIRTVADGLIREVVDGEDATTGNLRLRYERGRYFQLSSRFNLGLGAMIDPVVGFGDASPNFPLAFPTSYFSVGLDIGLVPSATFRVADRVSAFLEVPLSLAAITYSTSFVDNPFVTEDSRRVTDLTTDLLSNVQAGLGVRVAL